jgi:hypothetical protein
MLRDFLIRSNILTRRPIITMVGLAVLAELSEYFIHVLLKHIAFVERILLNFLILDGVKWLNRVILIHFSLSLFGLEVHSFFLVILIIFWVRIEWSLDRVWINLPKDVYLLINAKNLFFFFFLLILCQPLNELLLNFNFLNIKLVAILKIKWVRI